MLFLNPIYKNQCFHPTFWFVKRLKNNSQPKSWVMFDNTKVELRLIRCEFLGRQAQEAAFQVTLRDLLLRGGEGKNWVR